jgi:alpha-glucosidase
MKYIAAVYPLLILLLPLKSVAQDNLISHQIGAVKEVRKVDHVVHFSTADNEDVQISVLTPAIVRVRISAPDLPMSPSYAVIQNGLLDFNKMINGDKEITLLTDSLKIVVQKKPMRIDFFNAKGEWLDGDEPFLGVSRQGK